METVTIMSMQKNINESKESHSFIGESLENSDIEHLFNFFKYHFLSIYIYDYVYMFLIFL